MRSVNEVVTDSRLDAPLVDICGSDENSVPSKTSFACSSRGSCTPALSPRDQEILIDLAPSNDSDLATKLLHDVCFLIEVRGLVVIDLELEEDPNDGHVYGTFFTAPLREGRAVRAHRGTDFRRGTVRSRAMAACGTRFSPPNEPGTAGRGSRDFRPCLTAGPSRQCGGTSRRDGATAW